MNMWLQIVIILTVVTSVSIVNYRTNKLALPPYFPIKTSPRMQFFRTTFKWVVLAAFILIGTIAITSIPMDARPLLVLLIGSAILFINFTPKPKRESLWKCIERKYTFEVPCRAMEQIHRNDEIAEVPLDMRLYKLPGVSDVTYSTVKDRAYVSLFVRAENDTSAFKKAVEHIIQDYVENEAYEATEDHDDD